MGEELIKKGEEILVNEIGYEKVQDDVNWLIYRFRASKNEYCDLQFYKPQKTLNISSSAQLFNELCSEEIEGIYLIIKGLNCD